jgi:hypothetical protein
MSKAEQETILRFDRSEPTVSLWTANPAEARRWKKLGYDVRVFRFTPDGRPQSWHTEGPAGCLRLRRVADGKIVRRARAGENLAIHRRVPERTDSGRSYGLN